MRSSTCRLTRWLSAAISAIFFAILSRRTVFGEFEHGYCWVVELTRIFFLF
jgi:hypothetical protein